MFMIALVMSLFLINGCSTTKTAVAAVTSAQLTAMRNYSNINNTEDVGNFDLHIFTNDEKALIVPCYYWTKIDTNKN